jgi:N,N'-diacetyllegionaminate synthase
MKKVYVIAEAEINHNGDFETAKKMIKSATMCGANCIKFQYIVAEEIADKSSEYFDLFKKAELTLEEFVLLKEYAENVCNIDFMITAPSQKTYDALNELNFNKIKIGSSNLTNLLLLNHIALNKGDTSQELFISTGASNLAEINAAIQALHINEESNSLTIFHCTSVYPAPLNELNLNVIPRLVNLYPNINIGYSDHTEGSMAAMVSVALGANVIEKHFTLDKKMKGPDHFFSSNPRELSEYIENIRNVEKSLGSGIKEPSSSEKNIVENIRRYLIFNQSVDIGVKLNYEMFDTKRVGDKSLREIAVKASNFNIIDKLKSTKRYDKGDVLVWDDFSG